MKRKSDGLGTKIILVLLFFMGLCMIANLAFVFGETEEVESVVAVIMGVIMCTVALLFGERSLGR